MGGGVVMHLELPNVLTEKLQQYRQAVIRRAIAKVISLAAATVVLTLLILVTLDRTTDVPSAIRSLFWLACGTVLVGGIVFVLRSIASHRSAAAIAKEITQYDALFGDHLLGAIELADSAMEQKRSMRLCQAALQQVADETAKRNLLNLLPPQPMTTSRRITSLSAILMIALAAFLPQVTWNSIRRIVNPFAAIERLTLVQLDHIAETHVVPRGEATTWAVESDPNSRWQPQQADLEINGLGTLSGNLVDGLYTFQIPPLTQASDAVLQIGDADRVVQLQPVERPQLASVSATVFLPDYLQVQQQARQVEPTGNVFSVLEGSRLTLHLQTTAALQSATVDGEAVTVNGKTFDVEIAAEQNEVALSFTDNQGITAASESVIRFERTVDRAPTILIDEANVPSRVLHQQQLRFLLTTEDDFAVRKVGLEWSNENGSGERIIGPDDQSETLTALFSPIAFGVQEGETAIRFWAEDDLPGRARVYSPATSLTVLSTEDHAVWIGDQLTRWRQGAIEVRDRELRLLSANRDLMAVPESERDVKWRRQLAEQAAAEADNARRLKMIVQEGKAILSQAASNDQIPANNLEGLAQSINALDDLANGRMPRVAEMLNEASEAVEESKFAANADMESSQGELPDSDDSSTAPGNEAAGDVSNPERLGLSDTTIIDTSAAGKKPKEKKASAKQKLAEAVEDQAELVAKFDAVADQLRELLGQMDGSTLVKRMKAISRLQDRVAGRLSKFISRGFGRPTVEGETEVEASLADTDETVTRLQSVMDDLQAFLKRRDIRSFRVVYEEMKNDSVLDQLRLLKRQIPVHPGTSIAAAEFWADNLDRLADDLIEPPPPNDDQENEGGKQKKSLDPEIVLEVLRVLKSEVDLREETRQAERGREAMKPNDYASEAIRLSESQDLIRDRLDQVIDSLQTDRESAIQFAAEAEVLSSARAAMVDASESMVRPDTGPDVIAAQTEAIELLLRSRKVDPSSGGGSNSASSSGGNTDQEAIKLVGDALNELAEQRSGEVSTSTGASSFEVPERMRADLDRYFMRLEQRLGGTSQ